MSCSLCQRTCYAEPGWLRIEAYDRQAAADGRYPWGLVAICPSPDCRNQGGRLVSAILQAKQTAKEPLDPAWLDYAGLPKPDPTEHQSPDSSQPTNIPSPPDPAPSAIHNPNWSPLPPGRYPWSRVRQHVIRSLEPRNPRETAPVLARLETLASYSPDEVYIGEQGFSSYVAYIFKEKGLAVLESTMLDNATYVFNLEWHPVSQMTKAQILQGNLHLHRFIHTQSWQDRIRQLLQ